MNYHVVAAESVDFRIVTRLREIGLDVYSIAEELPSITDKSVLSIACDKNAFGAALPPISMTKTKLF